MMRNTYKDPADQTGFTLIELMIVVAIMTILASAAMPLRELMVTREKEQILRNGLRQIRGAIDAYKQAADVGRIETTDDKSGYPARLEDLFVGVKDLRSTEKKYIFFLRRLPRDPMYREFNVSGIERAPDVDTWGKRSYTSTYDNPREGKDVFDIFSRSESEGLNGIPYNKW